jgi:hypothetical protein
MGGVIPAGLRTAAADCGNVSIPDFFAGCRAGITYLSTGRARDGMKVGMPNHEIVCCLTHLCAIQQMSDMMGICVSSAFFQTIMHRM